MSSHKAFVQISPEILRDALVLPSSTEIIDIRINHEKRRIELLVEDEKLLEESPEGMFYPPVSYIIHLDNDGRKEFVKYEK